MKHLLSLLLAMLSLTAMAQESPFEQTYLQVSLSARTFQFLGRQQDPPHRIDRDTLFAGGSIGFHYGYLLTPSSRRFATYFDAGLETAYGLLREDGKMLHPYTYRSSFHYLLLQLPVDLVFQYIPRVSRPRHRLLLSAGIGPKLNIAARTDRTVSNGRDDDKEVINLFNAHHVGSDYTAHRLQAVANAGIGYAMGRWQIAYRYHHDITTFRTSSFYGSLYDDRLSSHDLTLSYTIHTR